MIKDIFYWCGFAFYLIVSLYDYICYKKLTKRVKDLENGERK